MRFLWQADTDEHKNQKKIFKGIIWSEGEDKNVGT